MAKIELTVGSSRSCTRWILHQSLSRARSKRSNGRLCPAMPGDIRDVRNVPPQNPPFFWQKTNGWIPVSRRSWQRTWKSGKRTRTPQNLDQKSADLRFFQDQAGCHVATSIGVDFPATGTVFFITRRRRRKHSC